MNRTLFTTDLPQQDWSEFIAQGFSSPVCGVIYRGSRPPVCGVPLGGIATGCLDIEASGTLGYSTIFNSLVPRRGPMNLPFLGISVGQQAWVCSMINMKGREDITWFDIYHNRFFNGIRTAQEIHYWGHYPVADLEFILDKAPLSVGLRAWSPFIPGDVAVSNTPGAIFEVHLRNASDAVQKGTLAFSFPGPSEAEAGTVSFERREVSGLLNGLSVSSGQASYMLGVIDETAVRTGGSLSADGTDWAIIEHYLPHAKHQAGACVAVDFSINPNEEKIVRYVLSWYSPVWQGGGTMTAGGNAYTHMYAKRFPDAEAVALFLAQNHASLLKRILDWQSVMYTEQSLPAWLRDSLINILHLITETSVWGQALPPIGDWCRPEDGLFGMNESPRYCPQIECIPCSYYGNLPLVYFFPALALSTLRGYKAYQYPTGQAPWVFGGCTVGSPPYELAMPSPGYANKPQSTLDGACYAEMVDKMWQRTGDDAILNEFYESVKQNTIFTMRLCSRGGPAAIVSMPDNNNAFDWYEFCDLFGVVPHIGGVHLAQLRTVKRMADAVGDAVFSQQCQEWLEQGSAFLEEHGWAGDYYLLFNELETGKKSNVILAHQLDGEWMALFHGLPGVFQSERVKTTLETIKRTSLARSEYGAAVFGLPEGASSDAWDPGYWAMRGVHPPGTFILSMLYLYNGQKDLGLDLTYRMIKEMIRRGWLWDWPVVSDGSMPRIGFDYYQNLVMWSLPAAISGGDLKAPCAQNGLVERMIRAGNPPLS
jgi:uncharacterized protein (DUF608 family)